MTGWPTSPHQAELRRAWGEHAQETKTTWKYGSFYVTIGLAVDHPGGYIDLGLGPVVESGEWNADSLLRLGEMYIAASKAMQAIEDAVPLPGGALD